MISGAETEMFLKQLDQAESKTNLYQGKTSTQSEVSFTVELNDNWVWSLSEGQEQDSC